MAKIIIVVKGGKGSGNFGHSGRPGKVGGSAGEGGITPKDGIQLGEGKHKVEIVADFAKRNGLNISISNERKIRDNHPILAEYTKSTGVITVYRDAPKDKELLNGVLSHEYMHYITERMSNSDLATIIKSVAGDVAWEDKAWKAMEDTGKFTEFSTYAWSRFDGNLAFKETIGEVARMYAIGKSNSVPSNWLAAYEKVMEFK